MRKDFEQILGGWGKLLGRALDGTKTSVLQERYYLSRCVARSAAQRIIIDSGDVSDRRSHLFPATCA